MSEGTKVQFVCVRAAHHRHTSSQVLCEHLGCVAYCPAGDASGHDWMPTVTDPASLARLGYAVPPDDAGSDTAPEGVDHERELLPT